MHKSIVKLIDCPQVAPSVRCFLLTYWFHASISSALAPLCLTLSSSMNDASRQHHSSDNLSQCAVPTSCTPRIPRIQLWLREDVENVLAPFLTAATLSDRFVIEDHLVVAAWVHARAFAAILASHSSSRARGMTYDIQRNIHQTQEASQPSPP